MADYSMWILFVCNNRNIGTPSYNVGTSSGVCCGPEVIPVCRKFAHRKLITGLIFCNP